MVDDKAPPVDAPAERSMAKLTQAEVAATAAQVLAQFVVNAR